MSIKFILYYSISCGACTTVYDAALMLLIKEKNLDYGKQRAWGTLGALTSAYLGGVLVDAYSEEGKPDYRLVYQCSFH